MYSYAQQINKDTDRLKKKLIGIFFFTKIKKEEYGWQKKKRKTMGEWEIYEALYTIWILDILIRRHR
jgi:hypothetical protein